MCGKVVFGRMFENEIALCVDQPFCKHFVGNRSEPFYRIGRVGEDNIETLRTKRNEIEDIVTHDLNGLRHAQRSSRPADE